MPEHAHNPRRERDATDLMATQAVYEGLQALKCEVPAHAHTPERRAVLSGLTIRHTASTRKKLGLD